MFGKQMGHPGYPGMTTLDGTGACHGFGTHLACLKPTNTAQHANVLNDRLLGMASSGIITRAEIVGQFTIKTMHTNTDATAVCSSATSKSVHWAADFSKTKTSQIDGSVRSYQDMVACRTLADIIGLTKFRDDRQERANVAIARATYIGIDTVDEDDIFVQPTVGLAESVLQQIDKKFGKKKHCTKHRTANRWAKRAVVVKCLVDTVKFKAPAEFTSSRADLACLRLVVRQVIDEAVKDGVEYRGSVMNVRKEERNYYLKAVASAYFIAEEDSTFWDALASCGEATTA